MMWPMGLYIESRDCTVLDSAVMDLGVWGHIGSISWLFICQGLGVGSELAKWCLNPRSEMVICEKQANYQKDIPMSILHNSTFVSQAASPQWKSPFSVPETACLYGKNEWCISKCNHPFWAHLCTLQAHMHQFLAVCLSVWAWPKIRAKQNATFAALSRNARNCQVISVWYRF